MTVVRRDGTVLDTGVIVRQVKATYAGGARTAAAIAASGYGLVVKVSADGPISFFRQGEEIYRAG